ncbi:MAG: hypothetical protein INR73_00155 [Williamsia sp.]|nr:hypothetical protein [Williamsia sp.]
MNKYYKQIKQTIKAASHYCGFPAYEGPIPEGPSGFKKSCYQVFSSLCFLMTGYACQPLDHRHCPCKLKKELAHAQT